MSSKSYMLLWRGVTSNSSMFSWPCMYWTGPSEQSMSATLYSAMYAVPSTPYQTLKCHVNNFFKENKKQNYTCQSRMLQCSECMLCTMPCCPWRFDFQDNIRQCSEFMFCTIKYCTWSFSFHHEIVNVQKDYYKVKLVCHQPTKQLTF